MISISPEIITLLMFAGVIIGVFTGYPLALTIGSIALIVGFAIFGVPVFEVLYSRLFSLMNNYTLLAVPLFIFMGVMLERSGITDRMFDVLYLWLGGLKGGLGITTVLVGTIIASAVGTVGASVTMLALTALPALVKRGYDKSLSSATVCAAGCLGILIPPSIMLVIYGPMANISVGKLFMAAVIPGLTLSFLYMLYIALRSVFQPELAPPIAPEERMVPFLKKTYMLVIAIVPCALLIFAVLGVIFLGIAPPTEAAAVGAFASIILAFSYGKLSRKALKETTLQTLKVSSMVYLIGGLSFAFVGVFIRAGGGQVVEDIILAAPGGSWGAFTVVMLIVFILGFFIDFIGILFILIPIISPIIPKLGFDPLWFAMMICVNFQTSFLTPPFAAAIFYLRGSAAPELGINMSDIIRGIWPYVALIFVGLALCLAFPELILWLPAKMIK